MTGYEDDSGIHADGPELRALVGNVDLRPFDFRHDDHNAATIEAVPEAFQRCWDAVSRLPESYRGFCVVATGIVSNTDMTNPVHGFITTGNYKAKLRDEERDEVDVEAIPKVCAEADLLIKAEELGITYIGAIVVAATTKRPRIVEVTGVNTPTLHPCGDCRDTLKDNELAGSETAIFSTGLTPDVDFYQAQSLRSCVRRYERLKRGFEFRDAALHPHLHPDEWAEKAAWYQRAVKKAHLTGNIYDGAINKELERRKLAFIAMSEDLFDLQA